MVARSKKRSPVEETKVRSHSTKKETKGPQNKDCCSSSGQSGPRSLAVAIQYRENQRRSTLISSVIQQQEQQFTTLYPDLFGHPTAGATVHERRRSEQLSSAKTPEDLHDSLVQFGYNLSRSTMYLRFQSWKTDSAQPRRQVKSVPVKLKRAQNNARKKLMDQNFAFTINEYTKEIWSISSPDLVPFLAVNCKAKVPLWIATTTKHAPILMHLDYEVWIPDLTVLSHSPLYNFPWQILWSTYILRA